MFVARLFRGLGGRPGGVSAARQERREKRREKREEDDEEGEGVSWHDHSSRVSLFVF